MSFIANDSFIHAREQLTLGFAPAPVSVTQFSTPTGYTGLSAFHKYWGKKPIECLGFLIEKLTQPHDLVVDPFVGSGLLARECAIRGRRFIGIDINPVSIELARFVSDLPDLNQYTSALVSLEQDVKHLIDESYALADGRTASHYLWDHGKLREIWIAQRGRGGREVRVPTSHDLNLFSKYEGYSSRLMRPIQMFQNSRINTYPAMGLTDIFTGRALCNIDLILNVIKKIKTESLRRALLLTLTASIGQMSKMVFAITGRGKTSGVVSSKIEVGSWVIGYWRPPVHFEINVWNCFRRRAQKLIASLEEAESSISFPHVTQTEAVVSGAGRLALLNEDALSVLKELPENSVSLFLTDPPHSDRIPYLELSELWNAVLGHTVDFEREVVVSNARERSKSKTQYNERVAALLLEISRVLVPGGTLALLFNARDAESWTGLSGKIAQGILSFQGCFPMIYSAGSVVQDNREGSMKSDYVLIYQKTGLKNVSSRLEHELQSIPGWSTNFPITKAK